MKPQAGSPPGDSPSSSTSPQGTLSPIKSFSPHHQPSPPTLPPQSKTSVRRVRRAPSLKKTRPSFSNSSGECIICSSKKLKAIDLMSLGDQCMLFPWQTSCSPARKRMTRSSQSCGPSPIPSSHSPRVSQCSALPIGTRTAPLYTSFALQTVK